jgi:hypothetical protein
MHHWITNIHSGRFLPTFYAYFERQLLAECGQASDLAKPRKKFVLVNFIVDNCSHERYPKPPPPPDRLSVDPRSPHYNAAIFEHDVGIKFNDKERFEVEEYCISEGWIKIPAGKALDRKGNPLMTKVKGTVEPFYR